MLRPLLLQLPPSLLSDPAAARATVEDPWHLALLGYPRTVRDPFMPVIASVECRSESRGEELPVAIVIGDERLRITDTVDRAMVTSVEAGGPVRHRLWVEVEGGRRFELIRVLPDGAWRVREVL